MGVQPSHPKMMAPHWPMSGGTDFTRCWRPTEFFQKYYDCNWIDKDYSIGTAQAYIVLDFHITCGEEMYYNKCRQYLPLGLMNHMVIIRKYNLPYWGHWSRASHTVLKTTIGLRWPNMGLSGTPSWEKIETGPTSSTRIIARYTRIIKALTWAQGHKWHYETMEASSQGSLLLLWFLEDVIILYLT